MKIWRKGMRKERRNSFDFSCLFSYCYFHFSLFSFLRKEGGGKKKKRIKGGKRRRKRKGNCWLLRGENEE